MRERLAPGNICRVSVMVYPQLVERYFKYLPDAKTRTMLSEGFLKSICRLHLKGMILDNS